MFDDFRGAMQSIFSWNPFSQKKKPQNVILLGLDCSGKTTFLYKIHGNREVVTTIPTIGMNVETLELKKTTYTCWDVGGCDKIRPLWRHFLKDASCLVLFVDSHDLDRICNVKEEMTMFLREEELIGVPLLIVANKQDLASALSPDTIVEKLGLLSVTDRIWHVMPASMNNGNEQEILKWLSELFSNGTNSPALEMFPGIFCKSVQTGANHSDHRVNTDIVPNSEANTHDTRSAEDVEQDVIAHERRKRELLWSQWLSRSVGMNDSNRTDDDAFLLELSQYTLTSWDHLTHVRLGWIYLTRLGLERGFNDIERTIEEFIAHSSNTNGKSFHPTMTRFWCHMIAYWLCKQRVQVLLTEESQSKREQLSKLRDFNAFLQYVHSNCDSDLDDLAHGGLFKAYFSSSRIFSDQAKLERVRPNLKALPDLRPLLRELLQCEDVLGELRDSDDCTARDDLLYMDESDYWMFGDEALLET